MSAPDLAVFMASSLLLLVLPGPAVVYVVSQVARHGLGRGLAGALGVELGTLVHALSATAGLSVLLARSEVAFAVVKYAGVGYLLWLGWRQLRTPAASGHGAPVPPSSSVLASVRQGFLVELLNPKTALFFIAFLPQFVGESHRTLHLGLLSGLFVVMALVVDGAYAAVAATVRRRSSGASWDRAGGLLMWGLAALAAGT